MLNCEVPRVRDAVERWAEEYHALASPLFGRFDREVIREALRRDLIRGLALRQLEAREEELAWAAGTEAIDRALDGT
jgi:hypothetical protein